jgi:hypothetical protein
MEEEEYNDIVTYIQDQNYPQNAEFLSKYINHYNDNVLIIFKKFSLVTFPQSLWLRSTQNLIFTLRFIIFFNNTLW